MAERKVRHAIVTYTRKLEDGRTATETAFRGMIVDIENEDELARLEEFDAVVPVEDDLERPGRMTRLSDAPTDEELINWVAAATESEIRTLVSERPSMGDRVANIQEIVERRYEGQRELLGEKASVAKSALEELPEPEGSGVQGDPTPVDPATGQVSDTAPPAPNPETYDLDQVVSQKVSDVEKFLDAHPDQAAAVLDAENRRAQAAGEDARQGVVRGVEAIVKTQG